MELKIHLQSKNGLYNVVKYTKDKIWLKTNHYSFNVPANDFKCIAGGSYNYKVNEENINDFLQTIATKEFIEIVEKIISLYYYMDFPLDTIETLVINEGINISKFNTYAKRILINIHTENIKSMDVNKNLFYYWEKVNAFCK